MLFRSLKLPDRPLRDLSQEWIHLVLFGKHQFVLNTPRLTPKAIEGVGNIWYGNPCGCARHLIHDVRKRDDLVKESCTSLGLSLDVTDTIVKTVIKMSHIEDD